MNHLPKVSNQRIITIVVSVLLVILVGFAATASYVIMSDSTTNGDKCQELMEQSDPSINPHFSVCTLDPAARFKEH